MAMQIHARNCLKSNPENKVGTKVESSVRIFRQLFLLVSGLATANPPMEKIRCGLWMSAASGARRFRYTGQFGTVIFGAPTERAAGSRVTSAS